MPYMHVFGNEEMKKKRERISVLNQNGNGLKNKDIALSLAELQSFMERARTAMQEEYGRDKTGREILLYLDKAGKAFEQLLTGKVRKAEGEQAPDAPAPDALEDALHILSGFKEQMLTRYGDEGKMVLDTIAQRAGRTASARRSCWARSTASTMCWTSTSPASATRRRSWIRRRTGRTSSKRSP